MGSVFDEKFNKSTLLVIDLEWDFVDKFEQKVDIADWELIEIGAATSTPSRHPRMLPITSKVIIPEIKQTVSKTFTDITNITNEEIRKNGISLQKALIQFFAVASKFKQWAFWGSRDIVVLRNAAMRVGVEFDMPDRVIDLKAEFAKTYRLKKSPSMLKAMCMLGITGDGPLHRAVNDAKYAARIHDAIHFRSEIELVSKQELQGWINTHYPELIYKNRPSGCDTKTGPLSRWEAKKQSDDPLHLDLQDCELPGVWCTLFDNDDLDTVRREAAVALEPFGDNKGREAVIQKAQELIRGNMRLAKKITQQGLKNMEQLAVDFGNFQDVISTIRAQLINAHYSRMPIKIEPMLLDGPPGTGKTEFTKALAKALFLPMYEFNIGSVHAKFEVTGGHPTWAKSEPGRITKYMLGQDIMNPIILMDEIERARTSEDIVQPLLQFIDRDQAKRAKDHFFDMSFDFANIAFIATSNTLDLVDPALRSRFHVFHIQPPTAEHVKRIARNIFSKVRSDRSAWYLDDQLSDEVVSLLSGFAPRDIRAALSGAINAATLRLEVDGGVGEGAVDVGDLLAQHRVEKPKLDFGFVPRFQKKGLTHITSRLL